MTLCREKQDLTETNTNRVQIDALLLQAQLLNTKVLDKPEARWDELGVHRAVI